MTAKAIKILGNDDFLDNLDLLVCGTTIPDQMMPNHALMVHGELNIAPLEVVSTAGICLSGATALKYAYTSIKSGEAQNAVCTGSENSSASMRSENFKQEINSRIDSLETNQEIAFEKDFLRWMLSDGAGAIHLSNQANEKTISLKVKTVFSRSYANEIDTCMYAGCDKNIDGSIKGWREYSQDELNKLSIFSVKQDVKLLNENIVKYTVIKPLIEMLEKKIFNPNDINWFLPHYSSDYFRNKLYDGMKEAKCDIPQEKWFINLSYKGNTGSASFYVMLEELFNNNRFKKGDNILCYVPESGRFSTAFILLEAV